jgi:hypothetical protein
MTSGTAQERPMRAGAVRFSLVLAEQLWTLQKSWRQTRRTTIKSFKRLGQKDVKR